MGATDQRETNNEFNETATVLLNDLIGFDTHGRPFESWYAFVSRLICANVMTTFEARKTFPSSWLNSAYDPFNAQVENLTHLKWLSELQDISCLETKVSTSNWVPFPTLSSVPPECLRGCPRCLANGYHSYATQADLLTHCPVHGALLTHRCPHCDRPLFWRGYASSPLAFRCPAGCPLIDAHASGLLLDDAAALEAAWADQLAAMNALKSAVRFVSGPVHVGYPPLLASSGGLRTPPLPTPGLLQALCAALRAKGVSIPSLRAFHLSKKSSWHFCVAPWRPVSLKMLEAIVDRMLLGFRRGAYHTVLPVVQPEQFRQWLEDSLDRYGPWLEDYRYELIEGIHWLTLPSFFLTNAELTALRFVLVRGRVGPEARAHYTPLLIDILARARQRRVALDSSCARSRRLAISDYVEGVVIADDKTWRIQGLAVAEPSFADAWADYREPAEIGDLFIHIGRRRDAF